MFCTDPVMLLLTHEVLYMFSVPGYDNGTAGYTDSKLYLDTDWLFYWSWTLFTIGEDCQ